MKRYYITDRKAVGGFRPLLEVIRDQMHLGVNFIQIREKDLTARELFEFTLAVIEVRDSEMRKRLPIKIFVNSRADLALATGADGVHLPSDAPQQTLPGLLVFRSCHTLEKVYIIGTRKCMNCRTVCTMFWKSLKNTFNALNQSPIVRA